MTDSQHITLPDHLTSKLLDAAGALMRAASEPFPFDLDALPQDDPTRREIDKAAGDWFNDVADTYGHGRKGRDYGTIEWTCPGLLGLLHPGADHRAMREGRASVKPVEIIGAPPHDLYFPCAPQHLYPDLIGAQRATVRGEASLAIEGQWNIYLGGLRAELLQLRRCAAELATWTARRIRATDKPAAAADDWVDRVLRMKNRDPNLSAREAAKIVGKSHTTITRHPVLGALFPSNRRGVKSSR